ncbi:MAG TPA: hypothetical protein VD970_01215 [Acetobacteraceae bacterium]|nr:hypothetical protein [Acetobacteraceae bacterium]
MSGSHASDGMRTPGTMDKVQDEAREAGRGLREEAAKAFEEVKAQGASVVQDATQRVAEFAEEQKEAGVRQAEGLARAIHRAADELEGNAPWMARYVHEAAESVDGMVRSLRDRRPRELLDSLESLARRQPMAFFGAAALAGFAIARFARSSPPDHRGGRYAYAGEGMGEMRRDRSDDMRGGGSMSHRGSGMGSAGGMGSTGGMSSSGGMGSTGGQASGGAGTGSGMGAPGWVGGEGPAKPATMAAASLGGAAARPQGGPGTPFSGTRTE